MTMTFIEILRVECVMGVWEVQYSSYIASFSLTSPGAQRHSFMKEGYVWSCPTLTVSYLLGFWILGDTDGNETLFSGLWFPHHTHFVCVAVCSLKMVKQRLMWFWFEGLPPGWSRCMTRADQLREQIALVWGLWYRICASRENELIESSQPRSTGGSSDLGGGSNSLNTFS